MPVVKSIQSHRAHAARRERARIYHDPRWRAPGACRDQVLHNAYGQCEYPDCTSPATIADHYPTPLAQLLALHADPFDPTTCRALCHHHSGKADGSGVGGGG